jgi:L-lactate permease
MRPEYMLWSLVFVPVGLLLVAVIVLVIRARRRGLSAVRQMRVLVPVAVGFVLFYCWLLEIPVGEVMPSLAIGVVGLLAYALALDRVISHGARRRVEADANCEQTPEQAPSDDALPAAGGGQRPVPVPVRWFIGFGVVLVAVWVLWSVWGAFIRELLAF